MLPASLYSKLWDTFTLCCRSEGQQGVVQHEPVSIQSSLFPWTEVCWMFVFKIPFLMQTWIQRKNEKRKFCKCFPPFEFLEHLTGNYSLCLGQTSNQSVLRNAMLVKSNGGNPHYMQNAQFLASSYFACMCSWRRKVKKLAYNQESRAATIQDTVVIGTGFTYFRYLWG